MSHPNKGGLSDDMIKYPPQPSEQPRPRQVWAGEEGGGEQSFRTHSYGNSSVPGEPLEVHTGNADGVLLAGQVQHSISHAMEEAMFPLLAKKLLEAVEHNEELLSEIDRLKKCCTDYILEADKAVRKMKTFHKAQLSHKEMRVREMQKLYEDTLKQYEDAKIVVLSYKTKNIELEARNRGLVAQLEESQTEEFFQMKAEMKELSQKVYATYDHVCQNDDNLVNMQCKLKQELLMRDQKVMERLQLLEDRMNSVLPPLDHEREGQFGGGGLGVHGKFKSLQEKILDVEKTANILSVHQLELELELQLQASLTSSFNGTCIMRIPNVAHKTREAQSHHVRSIYSPPFYTGRKGYKMCICVYLNGEGIGENTHLSLFFVIMKGEYDPLLGWPFDHEVSLSLIDRKGIKHLVRTFQPGTSSSFQQPEGEMNAVFGFPQFCALSVLGDASYVRDDVMFIMCVVDTSNMSHPN